MRGKDTFDETTPMIYGYMFILNYKLRGSELGWWPEFLTWKRKDTRIKWADEPSHMMDRASFITSKCGWLSVSLSVPFLNMETQLKTYF